MSPETVRDVLLGIVEPGRFFISLDRTIHSREPKPLCGIVTERQINIGHLVWGQRGRGVWQVINGEIIVIEGRTHVRCRIRTALPVTLFFVLWWSFAVWGGVTILIQVIQDTTNLIPKGFFGIAAYVCFLGFIGAIAYKFRKQMFADAKKKIVTAIRDAERLRARTAQAHTPGTNS